MTRTVVSVVLAYGLGSIPFALILARRVRGVDLRLRGSGNVGAANAFRTTGKVVGVATLALDMAKGVLSVLLAQRLVDDGTMTVPTVAGLAAVAGHIYPVWIHFRGGKGVATACGVFAVLAPAATAAAGVVFVVTAWSTRYVSLGSVAGTVALGPVAYWLEAPPVVVAGAAVSAAMIVFRHRVNLSRVRAGAERRIGRAAGGRST